MKKIICILTATRAEYGLLKPIIRKFTDIAKYDVKVVVTGAHLSPEFGLTYREIEEDGIFIDKKIEMLLSSDTPSAISKSMGLALIGFSDYFECLKPDLLMVLGDRYETLAVAIAASNQRIPIAHLYGGEITEGAVDDAFRHSITKLSYLHFTSTETYRNRVIQLGESPERVFNVGAIGIENIKNEPLFSRIELQKELELDLSKPYAVVTFHPTTLEKSTAKSQIESLLDACSEFKGLNFIFTKTNADVDGRIINQYIDKYAHDFENIKGFSSLGVKRYLSALKYSTMVIGNSSSGLLEAPSFGIPTVNIGDRQKGRLQSKSVINCESNRVSIRLAIECALDHKFIELSRTVINPYGDGETSEKITNIISAYIEEEKIDLKKTFFDCGGI